MPAEFEELRLQVSLVDNASAGLQELSRNLRQLSTAGHTEAFNRQTGALTQTLKAFGLEATGSAKAFEQLAERVGKAAGGMAAFGFASYEATSKFAEFAGEVHKTARAAEQMGISYGELKNVIRQYEVVGVAAEQAARIHAQVLKTQVDARFEASADTFKNLRQLVPDPNLVSRLQQALKAAPESGVVAENLWRKFLDDVGEIIRQRNSRQSEGYIKQQVQAAKNRILQTADIDLGIQHLEKVNKGDKDRIERDNEMAKRAEEFDRAWRETEQNVSRTLDLLKDVAISPDSPFAKFVHIAATTTGQMYWQLEKLHKDFAGKNYWKYFLLPPPIAQAIDAITLIYNLAKGQGKPPDATKTPPGKGPESVGGQGTGVVGGGKPNDLAKSLGSEAPILKPKRGPLSYDLDIPPMMRLSGGYDAMPRSTNIEDRRRTDDYDKARERNSLLLKQVNEKLFLALQGEPSTLVFGPANVQTGGGTSGGGGASGGYGGRGGGRGGGPRGASENYVPSGSKAPATGGRGGWWTTERISYAVDYLKKNAGLSDAGARGLVARWAGVESTSKGPYDYNLIGGGHYGIGQWSRDRGGGMHMLGDFEGQLKHAADELNGSEKAAGDALRAAKTDAEGAIGASRFERAERYNPHTGADAWVGKTLNTMRGPQFGAAAATPPPQVGPAPPPQAAPSVAQPPLPPQPPVPGPPEHSIIVPGGPGAVVTAPAPAAPLPPQPTIPGGTGQDTIMVPARPVGDQPIMIGFKGKGGAFDQPAFERYARSKGHVPVTVNSIDEAKKLLAAHPGKFGVYGFSLGAQSANSLLANAGLKNRVTEVTTIGPFRSANLSNLGNTNWNNYPDNSSGTIQPRGEGFQLTGHHLDGPGVVASAHEKKGATPPAQPPPVQPAPTTAPTAGGGYYGLSDLPHDPDIDVTHIHPELAAKIRAAYNAMPEDVKKTFRLRSGHRSHELQISLWEKYHHDRSKVAPPGSSRHEMEFAQAVDLYRSPALDWMHQHDAQFGLHALAFDYPHVQLPGGKLPEPRDITVGAAPDLAPHAVRTVIDKSYTDAVRRDVEAGGKLSADVIAAPSIKVRIEGKGAFTDTQVTRRFTPRRDPSREAGPTGPAPAPLAPEAAEHPSYAG